MSVCTRTVTSKPAKVDDPSASEKVADANIPARTVRVWVPAGAATHVLYVQDGKLNYVQNYVSRDYLQVTSDVDVPAGKHALRFEFEVTGEPDISNGIGTPGTGRLFIDDEQVGEAEFDHTTPLSLGLTGGITVGADPGAPVSPFYDTPFEFTGTVHSVTFDLSGDVIKDDEAEMRMIMARQ